MRSIKSAGIETGFVRAGSAFDPAGLGLLGREIFG